ncbi:hypothetical protein U9M48_021335 [Paspalum notatum var. saurae]|uniref:Glutaredoxin domain-containing protein n=1 Tax=Paspalum notatum var. saurae TaxID=547442 RepID=A0AAQ3WTL6_PASNO
MGCAGSKQAAGDVAVADVYRPPPTSVSLFDISAVEEPWLIAKKTKEEEEDDEEDDDEETTTTSEEEGEEDEKPAAAAAAAMTTVVPLPLLDKLEGYELAPASWSEVSKALEDMKPVLDLDSSSKVVGVPPPPPPKKKKKKKTKKQQQPPKEDDEAAATKAPPAADNYKDNPPPPELAGRRVVTDNPFLMRDRESSKGGGGGGGAPPRFKRRDPFEGCPERRPPGASGGGVVLYTTSLRGVRRTFEDCERAREAVEACAAALGVPGAVDERDVALHGEYLREVRELAGEGAPPPRLFVMGRYVGGAEEVLALADSGRLREMMRWAKARGDWEATAGDHGRACEGCGGARFVPCWECGGSCKVHVVVHDDGDHRHQQQPQAAVERCAKCNENGLIMCPICH